MIILSNTTDSLQANLANPATSIQPRCFASYREITSSSITPARNVTSLNGTTPVNIVGSPSASNQRVIDYISIFNSDVTTVTVTLLYNANSTTYNLVVATLEKNERLEYQEGCGFSVYSADGTRKENNNIVSPTLENTINYTLKSSDTTNTTTSYVDVANLSFSVTAGITYWFKFVIPYTSTATGNGSRFSINGPASPTFLVYQSEYSLSATTITTNRGLTTYDSPATANANSATTGSNMAIIEGIITPSANGTVIARFASETAAGNNITTKAGSVVFYQKIN